MRLVGYILPNKTPSTNEAEDSEEDEDEEEAPEFLDLGEMSSVSAGGQMFSRRIPPTETVQFRLLSGPVQKVEGRFALKNPWWEVTCVVRRRRDRHVVDGYPSYKLISDIDRQELRTLVSLFLTACNVPGEFISELFHWLPQNRDVSILNLMDILHEFATGAKAIAESIIGSVSHSVLWRQAKASLSFPSIMKYLPTLLPGQFAELLSSGMVRCAQKPAQTAQAGNAVQPSEKEEEEGDDVNGKELDPTLLRKVEDILDGDVWKLGFNQIIYRELKLVRCEVPLKAFRQCKLLEKIPALQRNALRVYEQLKKSCYRTGSTYVDQSCLCNNLGRDHEMVEEEVWEAIHFLKEQGVVVYHRQKVVLQHFWTYETGISECLGLLMESEPLRIHLDAKEMLSAAALKRRNPDKKFPLSDENGQRGDCPDAPDISHTPLISPTADAAAWEELDPDQVQAVEMICTNPVAVISGKGGCGKTTVVSDLLKAALSVKGQRGNVVDSPGSALTPPESELESEKWAHLDKEEILITAPTGKAASLLQRKTGFSAFTLHQVQYSFMKTKKDDKGQPIDWKFEPVRILVVDEGSLVSAQLLHCILGMLTKFAHLSKFIILGDIRQLPSIQPGNVLNDLFSSLRSIRWAIEMRTNHRAESELIVKNAGLIADSGMKRVSVPLDFDAIVDLGETMPPPEKKFIFIRLPDDERDDDLQTAVRSLIAEAPGLQDDSTSQFIAFTRANVSLINELCCKHYNGHITRHHSRKIQLQPGDKVCCTRNGYVDIEEDKKSQDCRPELEKGKVRLCNGEIFFIREDNTVQDATGRKRRYLTLEDCDGQKLTHDYGQLQRACRLRHSWARTIHTFQGSENETIVYVIGTGHAQNWKHVYTAVTRGQKRVYVVGKESALHKAIRTQDIPRNTILGGLVKRHVVKPYVESTPEKMLPGWSPQPFSQTATTPQHPGRRSACLQPRRLVIDGGHGQDAENTPADTDGTRELAGDQIKGNKRPSTEALEVPNKLHELEAASVP